MVGAGGRTQSASDRGAGRGDGRHVRVGPRRPAVGLGRGRLAQSNAEQVRMVRQIIEGLGRSVATPDEARAILSLKGGDQVAF